ncbi:efflux RND transporter periplasmic adaptor subunit [Desulfoluna sp.]|uniref:efflux RND transporter periplasmic adaptor subunit n=1 Tax=Desulfoluna sp. TaxID=2045199 RepID=UPI0026064966|nr:efflux RND transporter periplasmic adaptor subunit [Desulfoluna sp.]
MKKLMTILIVAALVIGGIFLVRHKKGQIAAAGMITPRATMVRTSEAHKGDLLITRTYLARIEPWRSASIGAQIASRIVSIAVHEGDLVSKGQVVAALDQTEWLARVRGLEAAVLQSRMQADATSATEVALKKTLRFRKRELERDELLALEGAIARATAETSADLVNETQGRLDALQKTVQAAIEQIHVRERELEQARSRLAYTQICAPFDGVVTKRLADPGDMAGPTMVLMKIEDHGRLKISFDVPQAELSRISLGMKVVVKSGSMRPLSVSRIHPSLNQNRTQTLECETGGNEGLRAGGTLPVDVVLKHFKDEVLLPEESLIPIPGGGNAVFIVTNGVTATVPVTVIGRNAGNVAVQGVDAGAEVIQNTYLGWNRLAAGEPVEVLP